MYSAGTLLSRSLARAVSASFARSLNSPYRSIPVNTGHSVTMAPALKLLYFDGKGRMEPLRWILEAAGLQYDTELFTFEQWPDKKPTTPYDSVPVLYVDGEPLCETLSIARYLGATAGLVSDNHLHNAAGDEVADITASLVSSFFNIKMHCTDEDEKKAKMTELMEKTIPKKLGVWEKRVKGNFLSGDKAMWQDIYMAHWLQRFSEVHAPLLAPYPKLSSVMNNVLAIDKLHQYLAKPSTYQLPL